MSMLPPRPLVKSSTSNTNVGHVFFVFLYNYMSIPTIQPVLSAKHYTTIIHKNENRNQTINYFSSKSSSLLHSNCLIYQKIA